MASTPMRASEGLTPMTTPRHPKPVIGLVGGIGAGKSSVANALARHGGRVVAEIGRASGRGGGATRESGTCWSRRHTICLSDWSSDVCSSDLLKRAHALLRKHGLDPDAGK